MEKSETKEVKTYKLMKEASELGKKRKSLVDSLKITDERLNKISLEIQELVK